MKNHDIPAGYRTMNHQIWETSDGQMVYTACYWYSRYQTVPQSCGTNLEVGAPFK
jgi:hypothetical protein